MKNRINRINEELRREIAALLRELKDPRIANMTSIVTVDVSNDMRHAKVFVSVLGDDDAQNETMAGLRSAEGFIRKELAHMIDLRYVPEVNFVLDHSIETGAKINKILRDIKGQNKDES